MQEVYQEVYQESIKVLGTTSIVEIEIESEEGSDEEHPVEKSKEEREPDDIMIDLIAKPEGVEPPNMDPEQNWTGFEIPSSSPRS